MTTFTVRSDVKGAFAVMTGTTGAALFHGGHGHTLFFGDNLAGVATFTGSACLG